jgi:hypothetical protein
MRHRYLRRFALRTMLADRRTGSWAPATCCPAKIMSRVGGRRPSCKEIASAWCAEDQLSALSLQTGPKTAKSARYLCKSRGQRPSRLVFFADRAITRQVDSHSLQADAKTTNSPRFLCMRPQQRPTRCVIFAAGRRGNQLATLFSHASVKHPRSVPTGDPAFCSVPTQRHGVGRRAHATGDPAFGGVPTPQINANPHTAAKPPPINQLTAGQTHKRNQPTAIRRSFGPSGHRPPSEKPSSRNPGANVRSAARSRTRAARCRAAWRRARSCRPRARGSCPRRRRLPSWQ